MAWVKIDDSLPDHPKLTGLTDAGCWLYVVALCYANRHLTDGYVPDTALTGRQRRHANQLETAGLLTRAPDDHGWLIHDYLAYQPSRAEVENRRKRWRDAGKKGAEHRWGTPSET